MPPWNGRLNLNLLGICLYDPANAKEAVKSRGILFVVVYVQAACLVVL